METRRILSPHLVSFAEELDELRDEEQYDDSVLEEEVEELIDEEQFENDLEEGEELTEEELIEEILEEEELDYEDDPDNFYHAWDDNYEDDDEFESEIEDELRRLQLEEELWEEDDMLSEMGDDAFGSRSRMVKLSNRL